MLNVECWKFGPNKHTASLELRRYKSNFETEVIGDQAYWRDSGLPLGKRGNEGDFLKPKNEVPE